MRCIQKLITQFIVIAVLTMSTSAFAQSLVSLPWAGRSRPPQPDIQSASFGVMSPLATPAFHDRAKLTDPKSTYQATSAQSVAARPTMRVHSAQLIITCSNSL